MKKLETQISIRLSEEINEKLEKMSEKSSRSRAVLIREALENYINKNTYEDKSFNSCYLLDNAGDIIIVNEVYYDGKTGRIIQANDTLCQRIGYSKEELKLSENIAVFDKNYYERLTYLGKGLISSKEIKLEGFLITKNDDKIPYEFNSKLLEQENRKLIVTIGRDIRDRKILENLKKENDFISAILDITSALIVVSDPEANIIYVNEAYKKLTGYSNEEELREKHQWNTVFTDSEREKIKMIFNKAIDNKEPFESEIELETKKGEKKYLFFKGTLTFNIDGSVKNLIATGFDITELKQLRELYNNLQNKMRQNIENFDTRLRDFYDVGFRNAEFSQLNFNNSMIENYKNGTFAFYERIYNKGLEMVCVINPRISDTEVDMMREIRSIIYNFDELSLNYFIEGSIKIDMDIVMVDESEEIMYSIKGNGNKLSDKEYYKLLKPQTVEDDEKEESDIYIRLAFVYYIAKINNIKIKIDNTREGPVFKVFYKFNKNISEKEYKKYDFNGINALIADKNAFFRLNIIEILNDVNIKSFTAGIPREVYYYIEKNQIDVMIINDTFCNEEDLKEIISEASEKNVKVILLNSPSIKNDFYSKIEILEKPLYNDELYIKMDKLLNKNDA